MRRVYRAMVPVIAATSALAGCSGERPSSAPIGSEAPTTTEAPQPSSKSPAILRAMGCEVVIVDSGTLSSIGDLGASSVEDMPKFYEDNLGVPSQQVLDTGTAFPVNCPEGATEQQIARGIRADIFELGDLRCVLGFGIMDNVTPFTPDFKFTDFAAICIPADTPTNQQGPIDQQGGTVVV